MSTKNFSPEIMAMLTELSPKDEPNGLLLGLCGIESEMLFIRSPGKNGGELSVSPLFIIPQSDVLIYLYLDSIAVNRAYVNESQSAEYIESNVFSIEHIDDFNRQYFKLVENAEVFLEEFVQESKIAYQNTGDGISGWQHVSRETLLFATPWHVSTQYSIYGYQGGAHGYYSSGKFTQPIFNEEKDQTSIEEYYTSAELSGLIERMVLKSERGEFIDGHFENWEEEKESIGTLDVDEIGFYLHRKNGQTHITCFAKADAPYVISSSYYVTVEEPFGPAKENLVKHNEFPLNYSVFEKAYEGVRDVFISPHHNFILVLTRDELIGIDVINKIEYMRETVSPENVVIVEWITKKKRIEMLKKAIEELYEDEFVYQLDSIVGSKDISFFEREIIDPFDFLYELPQFWTMLTVMEEEMVILEPYHGMNLAIAIGSSEDGFPTIEVDCGYDVQTFIVSDVVENAGSDNATVFHLKDREDVIEFSWVGDEHRTAAWYIPFLTEYDQLFVSDQYLDDYEVYNEEGDEYEGEY